MIDGPHLVCLCFSPLATTSVHSFCVVVNVICIQSHLFCPCTTIVVLTRESARSLTIFSQYATHTHTQHTRRVLTPTCVSHYAHLHMLACASNLCRSTLILIEHTLTQRPEVFDVHQEDPKPKQCCRVNNSPDTYSDAPLLSRTAGCIINRFASPLLEFYSSCFCNQRWEESRPSACQVVTNATAAIFHSLNTQTS